MEPVQDPEVLAWLDERAPHGSVWAAFSPDDADGAAWGYDAIGWEASIWILHAIYENEELPAEITHEVLWNVVMHAIYENEELPAEITHEDLWNAGDQVVHGEELEGLLGEVDRGVLLDAVEISFGYEQGRSHWPGPGWQRLPWRELARRLDVDPFERPPTYGAFRYPGGYWGAWPANITPPAWGSLDREQFLRLVDQLARATPSGHNAACAALYALEALGGEHEEPVIYRCIEHEEPVIYRCKLQELVELYDDEDLPGSPNNIWPDDKSWFIYTDADLCATRVSGASELIDQLTRDTGLETTSLSF